MLTYEVTPSIIEKIASPIKVLGYTQFLDLQDSNVYILSTRYDGTYTLKLDENTAFQLRKTEWAPSVSQSFHDHATHLFYRDGAENFTNNELKEDIIDLFFRFNRSLSATEQLACIDFVYWLDRPNTDPSHLKGVYK